MKIFLGFILLFSLFIFGICIHKTVKEKHKLSHVVRNILLCGFWIVFFNLISLFTESEVVCMFAYSVYFLVSDWMLYFLLRFSIEFIGSQLERYIKNWLLVALLWIDTGSLFLNNVYHHLFVTHPVILFGDELYFELRVTKEFYIHYAIVLILIALCLISLFYGAVRAPKLYRRKYALLGGMVLLLIILNIFTVKSAVDVSVMGYVVAAVCIYYCTFIYTPQKLLSQTLLQVSQDVSFALLVLDYEGKVMYTNKMAQHLLDKENPVTDADGTLLKDWCFEQYSARGDVFEGEYVFYCQGKKRIYQVQQLKISDEKNSLQGGYFIIQDRTEDIEKRKEEKYLATHDPLTGLYNKQFFYETVKKHICEHPDTEFFMICTDINDFKMINDFFGTEIGDALLIQLAGKIKRYMDKISIYGRIGNDIFAVLMPKSLYNEAELEKTMRVDPFVYNKRELSFPVMNYIGVYEIVDRSCPVSVMCDRARRAINLIKGDYRKRISVYDASVRENILHEQELISELQTALEQRQFQMYLQPQVDTSGTLLGAEALIRWRHPKKGMILPNEFIPIFEKNGLISDLDRYLWEEACKKLQQWKKEGRTDLYISVNISPKDFYYLNLDQIFTELVETYEIAPKNLKLEITETAVILDVKRQIKLIEKFRQKGFTVEMDDFGSGYSSLNMLKDIYVDVLKIDMVFLQKCKDEKRSRTILQIMITLAKKLGMPVVAEGVESIEQVRYLTDMGCDIFQGYYFSEPMSIEAFERFYEKHKK
ncbi:MAG: EAL domain-containing protein [Lachnospiraceae bacterium]